jgi:hypothetical protein
VGALPDAVVFDVDWRQPWQATVVPGVRTARTTGVRAGIFFTGAAGGGASDADSVDAYKAEHSGRGGLWSPVRSRGCRQLGTASLAQSARVCHGSRLSRAAKWTRRQATQVLGPGGHPAYGGGEAPDVVDPPEMNGLIGCQGDGVASTPGRDAIANGFQSAAYFGLGGRLARSDIGARQCHWARRRRNRTRPSAVASTMAVGAMCRLGSARP